MKYILPVTLLMLFLVPRMSADESDVNELYRQAVQHYRLAEYPYAITLFRELYEQGYESFDLLYNLGNSYYKNGDLGQSILFYERALILHPGHEDVLHNINVVRARLSDKVEPIPLIFFVQWWNDFKQAHRPETFFYWSVLFFTCLAAAVFVFFAYRRVVLRRSALVFGIISLSLFIVSLIFYMARTEELHARRNAIIMSTEVTVRSSPDATAVKSFVVHEGLKVTILEERDGYNHIRLVDGKTGWVDQSVIERI
ncbi:MAG: tetratricopeptide repeat protein [Bacteroidetes bacterium]|nr:tetratricopeptide repeat protein [Bacteroidota bacterium]